MDVQSVDQASLGQPLAAGGSRWHVRRLAPSVVVTVLAALGLVVLPTDPAAAGDPASPVFRPPAPLIGLSAEVEDPVLAFGDLDADGDQDLVAGGDEGTLTIFSNLGSPARASFVEGPYEFFGDVGSDSAPALGDLDADGDLDALVGSGIGEIYYFENSGSPENPEYRGSQEADLLGVPLGFATRPSMVDIDADGDLDVFVGNSVGLIYFLENSGGANRPLFLGAPALQPFGLAFVQRCAAPRFVDVDGDGDFDVFIGSLSGEVFFQENVGTAQRPRFAPYRTTPFGLRNIGQQSEPVFVDIDADGDFDAFVTNSGTGDSSFFRNVGSAKVPVFDDSLDPFGFGDLNTPVSPEVVDFDGDGDVDVIIGRFRGSPLLHENVGSPTLPVFAEPLASVVPGGRHPDFGDIDGDGDLDAFNSRGVVTFFENLGTEPQTFGPEVRRPFGLDFDDDDVSPELVDLDGDGDLDVVVGNRSGDNLLFENTGDSSVPRFGESPITRPFGVVDSDSVPTLADIDADGDLDAVVGAGDGDLFYFENEGTPKTASFRPPLRNPFGLVGVGFRSSPAFADVDADGDLDAFVGTGYGRTIYFENLTRSLPPGGSCVGDCRGDGAVSVDELITGINIALGSVAVAECLAFDGNADGSVTVDEIVSAVNAALSGCPSIATPTPTRSPTPLPTLPGPTPILPTPPLPEVRAGDFDRSFGVNGVVKIDIGEGASVGVVALALRSDGKIVVAGALGGSGGGANFLALVDESGRLDPGFGDGGIAVTEGLPTPEDMAVQPDDGIVVVADRFFDRGGLDRGSEVVLTRYRPDGRLDTTFGDGGVVVTNVATSTGAAAVVAQPDGGILVAGTIGEDAFFDASLVVLRYLHDGNLDPDFGTGGFATDAGLETAFGAAMALQPEGEILVAGATERLHRDVRSLLFVRFTAEGEIDSSFGRNGSRIVRGPLDSDGVADLALGLDGKITATVCTAGRGCDFTLVQLLAAGELNESFGAGGFVTVDAVDDDPSGIAAQTDGRLLAIGGGSLVRIRADGELDDTFGGGGIVDTRIRPSAVIVQQDGRAVVASGGATLQMRRIETVP